MTYEPVEQIAGAYHHIVGDVRVTALNDGMLEASVDWLTHINPLEAASLLRVGYRADPPRITINAFLLRWHGHTVLVDTGCGKGMGPTLGRLRSSLAAVGVALHDIQTVLLTHLHPDHVGGLVDDDGHAVLPGAELIAHEAELVFWQDDAVLAKAAQDMQGHIRLARTVLAAYRGRVRMLRTGEALPGISAVPLPGHTPGHTGWLISSGSGTLLIWGDAVHMPGIQFARPGVGVGFDVDGGQAIETRKRIMDVTASDRLLVAGMHLDFPAFGHVVRSGDGYAYVPEIWTP